MTPLAFSISWVAGTFTVMIGVWVWTARMEAHGAKAWKIGDVWFYGGMAALFWPLLGIGLVMVLALRATHRGMVRAFTAKTTPPTATVVIANAHTRELTELQERLARAHADEVAALQKRIHILESSASYRELRSAEPKKFS